MTYSFVGVCNKARRMELSKSAERGLTAMTSVSLVAGEASAEPGTTCYINTRNDSKKISLANP